MFSSHTIMVCVKMMFQLSVLHCCAPATQTGSVLPSYSALIFLSFTHFHCSITAAQISCTRKMIDMGQAKPEQVFTSSEVVSMDISLTILFESKIQFLKCVFPAVVLYVCFKLVDLKLFLYYNLYAFNL